VNTHNHVFVSQFIFSQAAFTSTSTWYSTSYWYEWSVYKWRIYSHSYGHKQL